MADQNRGSYRQILKATSIFGGVQLANVIITIIRGKLMAVLVGTAGMGLNGLFLSTINMIRTLTSLGIPESAIRDIAQTANSPYPDTAFARVATIFSRWTWATSIIAVVFTIAMAKYLSIWTFKTDEKFLAFCVLSSTFIFAAVTTISQTYLRGLRKLRSLAILNISNSIVALIATIAIVYFFGIDGIVPALVASAAGAALVAYFLARHIVIDKPALSMQETFSGGKEMAKLGVNMSLSAFYALAISFGLNVFITRFGTIKDVGLYNAGQTIISSYVGLVFTSMGSDYYPRLSECINQKERWRSLVNEQTEIALLILTPLFVLLIAAAPLVIRILLTKEFLPVVDFFNWAVLGLFLNAIVWTIGYIILAKGNHRMFLVTTVIANTVLFALNLSGYYFFGLRGLDMAIVVSNLFSLMLTIYCVVRYFDFTFSKSFFRLTIILFCLCLGAFGITQFYPNNYFLLIPLTLITAVYSVLELEKRIRIIEIIRSKMRS